LKKKKKRKNENRDFTESETQEKQGKKGKIHEDDLLDFSLSDEERPKKTRKQQDGRKSGKSEESGQVE